jgi:hypothetical protein
MQKPAPKKEGDERTLDPKPLTMARACGKHNLQTEKLY